MSNPRNAPGHLDLPSMPPRRNLREQVAHALRAALVTGEMRPGVAYSAPMLAAQLGVSPTPVREAMLDLAKEGLVEVVRNKGFRVVELCDRDLDELIEIRELIEVPVIAGLAGRVSAEDAERMRCLVDRALDAAESGDTLEYIDADRGFHLGLLGLAGNAQLVEVVRELRDRARLYWVPALAAHGELTRSAREHGELLDLIIAGRVAEAGALMRRHLSHVRDLRAR